MACPLPVTRPCATSARRRPLTRSRPRALVPGAGELHRRGHGRAPAAWQPRRDPRGDRCACSPSPARGSPSPASSRAARSRTASSISPRSKAWPIWSMPRPRRNGARRWRSRKARCGISTKAGARSCSARRRLIEAGLDFADEGDVATDVVGQGRRHRRSTCAPRSRAISPTIAASACATGSASSSPVRPTPASRSLLNALAKRDVAIVSEEAGTTRDVIEVHLDLGGMPVILVRHGGDTRGARQGRGRGD